MIGAKFCHACGLGRTLAESTAGINADVDRQGNAWLRSWWVRGWVRSSAWAQAGAQDLAAKCRDIPFPSWLRYLHFHEIKRWVGLPTAALIAFIIGIGCIAGALAVSMFYK